MQSTGKGLSQFSQPAEESERGDPWCWPKLCMAMDQHSTQLCASAFLLRKGGMNMEVAWDLAIGYWGHELLCMLAYNTPCGPWADDARWHQCCSALESMFARTRPSDSPLFLSALPALAKETQLEGCLASDDPEETIWAELQRNSPWRLKGEKVVLNRFMGARRKGAQELAHWTKRSFAYTLACMELGFFRGAAFTRIVTTGALEEGAEAGGSTSSKKPSKVEQSLRSACQNCMVVAALVYGEPDNRLRQGIFIYVSGPWDAWHSRQSLACRSVQETQQFLQGQVGGDFLQTCSDTFHTTRSPAILDAIGFSLPASSERAEEGSTAWLQARKEDEFADDMCQLALQLVGHRIRRLSFLLRGWPGRSVGFFSRARPVSRCGRSSSRTCRPWSTSPFRRTIL